MRQGEHIGTVVAGNGPFALLPLHASIVGLVLLMAFATVMSQTHLLVSAHGAVAVSSGVAVMVLIAYMRYGLGFPWLSAVVVYLLLFWMFHFGMAFTGVLAPWALDELHSADVNWLFLPNARVAMLIAVIGAAGFAATAGLFAPRAHAETSHHGGSRTVYVAGWLLMLTGMTGAVIFLFLAGGLGIFSMGYMELRVGVLGTTYTSLAIDMSQLGCVFAVCGGANVRQSVAPVAVWSLLGLLVVSLGLRTEALVPLVTYALLLAHRGIHLPRAAVITAVIVALFAIPAIRTVRLVGISNWSAADWTSASPLGTFTELGGTLRATKAYVDWIDEGDDYLLGGTYWAPFDRQLVTRLIAGRRIVPREDDPRIPTRFISGVGAVGLSAVGEAYYNFGPAGPLMYCAALGLLFGWLERRAPLTPYHGALLGIASIVLFFNIRGDWLAVPARIGMAASLLFACYAFERFTQRTEAWS